MVEFNFPLITPAIGAIFFNISSCVKVDGISTLFKFNFMLKVGVFCLVETVPFMPIFPPKTSEFTFCNVTAWSFIISFPATFFKIKLSYKTVFAFAVKEQSKNAGIFTGSEAALVSVLVGSVVVIKSVIEI